MAKNNGRHAPRYKPIGALLLLVVSALVAVALVSFAGGFEDRVPFTVASDRSGLVMEPGAKVRYRGAVIGRVATVEYANGRANLDVEIDKRFTDLITTTTGAQIKATTAFGEKYVDLTTSAESAGNQLAPGSTIQSTNVTTEVNTVFENLTAVMKSIEPEKLSATLGAVADALRGRGQALGETLTNANSYLTQLNPELPQLQDDLRKAAVVTNTYGDAANDIVAILDAGSTTSNTIVGHEQDLDALLISVIGLGNTGRAVVSENSRGIEDTLRLLVPTTKLLKEYSPSYTCMLNNAVYLLGSLEQVIANTGYSDDVDAALLYGDDPYRYPENLPIVNAKGGPRGKPGCYARITADNYPAPYLTMDYGATLNQPGSFSPRVGAPSVIEYLFGNALGGPGRR